MDRWTSSENSEKFNDNCTYFIIQKCGYVDKKLFLCFMFSFFLVPFKFLEKSVDRWTSFELSEKKINFMYIFHFSKVWNVDKKLSFHFMFSFFLVLFHIFSKIVDRWTSSEYSEKKSTPCMSLLQSVDMWTIRCLSISCFLSFLYPLRYLQKVWTCGQDAVFLFHVFFSFLVL